MVLPAVCHVAMRRHDLTADSAPPTRAYVSLIFAMSAAYSGSALLSIASPFSVRRAIDLRRMLCFTPRNHLTSSVITFVSPELHEKKFEAFVT